MSTSSVPHASVPRQSPEKYAAIYARVSTSDQADKGYSLPTQIEACLDLAEREGYVVPPGVALWREALRCLREWEERRKGEQHGRDKLRGIELWNTLVQHLREQRGALAVTNHVFVDDYTGTSLTRPQFSKLRDLVHQRLVQAVFVHDLDRLSRKLAHQLLLTDEMEVAGVALRVVTMPATDQTPETQLLAVVRGGIAEYERLKILERTRRGLRGRAQAGHIPGGRRLLGYLADGTTYRIHPEEAALVQRIFALYLGGMSQDAIAGLLTHEGICPPSDRKPGRLRRLAVSVWHQSAIETILHNTAYIGTLYYGKKQRMPGKGNPDKKTTWRKVPREEWLPVPVPQIIDEATFQAAEALAVRNRAQSKRNRWHEYLLVNGRLRCGQCGSAMAGHPDPRGITRYRCTRPHRGGLVVAHTIRSIGAKVIEAVVWQAVERVLRDPDLIAAELKRRRASTDTQQSDMDRERQQYQRQLKQCNKELQRWEAAYVGEVIDLGEFKAKKTEVGTRRTSAEAELARLDAEQRVIEQAKLEAASLHNYCARVRANLQQLTMAEKRQALDALDIRVTWHPDWPAPKIEGRIPIYIASDSLD